MMQSRSGPAFGTTYRRSRRHHGVGTALTRTTFVPASHSWSRSARTTRSRVSSVFSSGATASSRSRKTWSAGNVAAFASIFSLDPGTARHDRRRRTGSAATLLDFEELDREAVGVDHVHGEPPLVRAFRDEHGLADGTGPRCGEAVVLTLQVAHEQADVRRAGIGRARVDRLPLDAAVVDQLEAVVASGETEERLVKLCLRIADNLPDVLLAVDALPDDLEPEEVPVERERPLQVGDLEGGVMRADDAHAASRSGTRKLRRNSHTTVPPWFEPLVSIVTTPVPGRDSDARASTTVLSP